MVLKAILLLVFSLLCIRHVPQLIMDLRNIRREPILRARCPVKSYHIIVLYCGIMGYLLLELWKSDPVISWSMSAGLFLFMTGILLGSMALWTIGQSYSNELTIFKGSKLITSGIYGVVRHPLRLALSIELLGAVLMAQEWTLVFPWLCIIFCQALRTKYEGRMLYDHYGELIIQYHQTVPSYNIFLGIARRIFNQSTKQSNLFL